ncbi:uncharacterized protein FOMMEDRAFT_159262 [Fomitiporia mediterranea MF3/22]|uniref:uncharacterized protein n=1 Tax=Fomitiporia mediterranea (strain MF3/22) TaxID=694068 RepID=UPI00044081EC|nr:uncharacterized protein FOMMEDRAFT_159262 [Fomitiporia mediterranea MF3/22]EJD00530.1 hypothetical protein FOMMEDRAFT_159262 [Fomitiporia mediterranea MF3/22]
MVLTRAMWKQLAATRTATTETTVSNETTLTHSRRSRIAHSGNRLRSMAREGTAVYNNAAEGSANVRTNAFSTSTESAGAFQPNTVTEDQSSNTQTVQAAHVVETESTRNAEVIDSQPLASGSSSKSSQDPCVDLPNTSFPNPPKPKSRKKRGHGWSRRKTARATTQGRTVQAGGKRRVEDVDGEEDENRPRKRQRISEEGVAGPSNAHSTSFDSTMDATIVKQLRTRSIVFSDGPANSGRGERSRTTRSPSPDRAPVRSTIDDPPAIGVELVQIKTEEEEEDNLFDTLLPCDWSPLMPGSELTDEDTFKFDSNRSTPELSNEHSEYSTDKSESVGSTPIRTPRAQSVDVETFERSLVIVLPGMIEEMAPPDELMDIQDEEENEDEIDAAASGPFSPADRRRSRAPSPPSLPPSLPVSRFATPQRDEETDSARYLEVSYFYRSSRQHPGKMRTIKRSFHTSITVTNRKTFERSLVIVLPGMIEEMAPPDELMDIQDEEENEDEIDAAASGPFSPADRRRSRAPSPPSLPPSLPVSRFATPQRDEETDSARYLEVSYFYRSSRQHPEENAYDQEIIPHVDYGNEPQSWPARPPGFLCLSWSGSGNASVDFEIENRQLSVYSLLDNAPPPNAIRRLSESSEVYDSNSTVSSDAMAS